MNEDKTYEPKKIEIEVGNNINALTIADGIMQFLAANHYSRINYNNWRWNVLWM